MGLGSLGELDMVAVGETGALLGVIAGLDAIAGVGETFVLSIAGIDNFLSSLPVLLLFGSVLLQAANNPDAIATSNKPNTLPDNLLNSFLNSLRGKNIILRNLKVLRLCCPLCRESSQTAMLDRAHQD